MKKSMWVEYFALVLFALATISLVGVGIYAGCVK